MGLAATAKPGAGASRATGVNGCIRSLVDAVARCADAASVLARGHPGPGPASVAYGSARPPFLREGGGAVACRWVRLAGSVRRLADSPDGLLARSREEMRRVAAGRAGCGRSTGR